LVWCVYHQSAAPGQREEAEAERAGLRMMGFLPFCPSARASCQSSDDPDSHSTHPATTTVSTIFVSLEERSRVFAKAHHVKSHLLESCMHAYHTCYFVKHPPSNVPRHTASHPKPSRQLGNRHLAVHTEAGGVQVGTDASPDPYLLLHNSHRPDPRQSLHAVKQAGCGRDAGGGPLGLGPRGQREMEQDVRTPGELWPVGEGGIPGSPAVRVVAWASQHAAAAAPAPPQPRRRSAVPSCCSINLHQGTLPIDQRR
jgi:hypothetical protein